MLNKYSSIFIFFFICCKLLNSQVLFSKHFARDSGYFYFSSVLELNNCIYVLVDFNDNSINSRYGSSGILKLDKEGNVLSLDTIHPSGQLSYSFPQSLQQINDSLLFYVTHDTSYLHLMEYNIHSRLINKISFKNTLGQYIYLYSYGILHNNDFYTLSSHSTRRRRFYPGNNSVSLYDGMISKISNKKLDRQSIVSYDTLDLVGYNITKLKNGNLAVMGIITNYDFAGLDDYIFRNFIFEYNDSLNLERQIISPIDLKLGVISEIVEDNEGNLYAATNEVKYTKAFSGGYYRSRPSVCKYDKDYKFLWNISYIPFSRYSYDKYNSLCFDKDSLNLIVVGKYETIDTSFLIDSMTSERWIVQKGLITKTDLDGKLIWNRSYIARGNEFNFNFNEFTNIKRLNSGGYIICGSNDYYDHIERSLQGWLMKVDEYGCLIPGCHLVNTILQDKIDLKFYPNPATHYISVIHGSNKSMNLEMFNQKGNMVLKENDISSLETYVFDIRNLPMGEYYVLFKDNTGKIISTEKIIKMD